MSLKLILFYVKYEGVDIKSRTTLSISPSGFSSISSGKMRIYHPGGIAQKSRIHDHLPQIEVKPFLTSNKGGGCKKCVESNTLDEKHCTDYYSRVRAVGYKIRDKNSFIPYIRHLGIPLFYSSFDLYAFFISLMCSSNFYEEVMTDSLLLQIWQQLWIPSEYDIMMASFVTFRLQENMNFNLILDFLSSYHLRCDALECTWNSIKNL